jgi:sn-glycerol 3-phosphate transport system permease protein
MSSVQAQPSIQIRDETRTIIRTPKHGKTRWGVHLALIIVCMIMCFPAVYALQMATLTLAQAFLIPPQLFPPGGDLLQNINSLFTTNNFGGLIFNTVVISLVIVIGKTTLAMLAGLAFVYFHFPGKWMLFFFVLLTLLMPTEIILLPLFRLVSELGWLATDTAHPKLALTIPFLATATGAFLFRQHFSNIPRELAEAAQIDGAGPLRYLISVLIPMSWNVIGAHALIQFISSWNQYLWPILIIQNKADQVIQVGVRNAVNVGTQTDYGLLMAAGIVASIPPLILFVVMQKQFMNGFALTRDK